MFRACADVALEGEPVRHQDNEVLAADKDSKRSVYNWGRRRPGPTSPDSSLVQNLLGPSRLE